MTHQLCYHVMMFLEKKIYREGEGKLKNEKTLKEWDYLIDVWCGTVGTRCTK